MKRDEEKLLVKRRTEFKERVRSYSDNNLKQLIEINDVNAVRNDWKFKCKFDIEYSKMICEECLKEQVRRREEGL